MRDRSGGCRLGPRNAVHRVSLNIGFRYWRELIMSFQDIEAGLARPGQPNSISNEDSAFLSAQSSLSLQVFKINSNVQGILKLVDQLGTAKDSATLRKSLYVLSC